MRTAFLMFSLAAAAAAGLALASAAAARTAELPTHGGIPEGIWSLNQERSVELAPGRQTLWIVRDDGVNSTWISVRFDQNDTPHISTWSGVYGGPPTPVLGTPMVSQVVRTASGIHNFGAIDGLGPYSEECAVDHDAKRLICHGDVTTAKGIRHWTDDFDWIAAGPADIGRRRR